MNRYVEPKFDGQWARLRVTHFGWTLSGRSGSTLGQKTLSPDDRIFVGFEEEIVLFGEFVFTQSRFYAFDLESPAPYGERRAELAEVVEALGLDWIEIAPTFPSLHTPQVWQHYVMDMGMEGVVFKSDATRPGGYDARRKRVETWDFVVTRILTSPSPFRAGMATGLGLGLYRDGALVEVGKVTAGFGFAVLKLLLNRPEVFVGKTVEVRGQERYPSGAVRHPVYVCMRTDKPAEECVL